MPGWRGICEFARDIRELVRDDWLFMWFLAPVTGALLALIFWLSWLSGVVLSITSSQFWMLATGTERGAGVVFGIIGGFATLTAGHMINSWLTRRRDDRLRKLEARALAAALDAETRRTIADIDGTYCALFRHYSKNAPPKDKTITKDLLENIALQASTNVYSANFGRLGYLGPDITRKVIGYYAQLAEFVDMCGRARIPYVVGENHRSYFLELRSHAEELVTALSKFAELPDEPLYFGTLPDSQDSKQVEVDTNDHPDDN